jgi:hypothetical protein
LVFFFFGSVVKPQYPFKVLVIIVELETCKLMN